MFIIIIKDYSKRDTMRKLIPKEELDALFKEIYSAEITEPNYTTPEKEEVQLSAQLKFLMYRYKTALRRILISNLPVKVSVLSSSVSRNREIEDKNNFLFSYDVEGKFRFFIVISENITSIERKIYEENIYSLFKNDNNLYSIMESISLSMVKTIQNDFPFRFKKINSSAIQFYNDDFIAFDYAVNIADDNVTVSIFFEELMLEAVEPEAFIYSPPTSYGRKLLEKLKRKITVELSVESEPVNIDLNMLKEGTVVDLSSVKFINGIKGEER